jgi:DNA-3-methyladenine glycosylase
MKIERDFYTRDTLTVAKELLGQYIVRKYRGKLIIGKIVETEAYIGPKDKASHAYSKKVQPSKEKIKVINKNWRRIKQYIDNKDDFIKRILRCKKCKVTKRNLAEYLKGGHIYIYLIYGNYYQLNITTFKEGYPECVLIRSLEPIPRMKADNESRIKHELDELDTNDKKRIRYELDELDTNDLHTYKPEKNLDNKNIGTNQRYNPHVSLVNPKGPGKVCEYLKLDQSFWGEDLGNSKRIWLEYGEKIKDSEIVKAKRIGIDYAEEYKNKLWRFYIKNNRWVSKK